MYLTNRILTHTHIDAVHALQYISIISLLIFNSHLHLTFPNGLFLLHFPTKTLHTSVLTYIRVTYPAHLVLLDLTTRRQRRSNHEAPHCAISSTLIDKDTFLCTLRLNPLSLRSSLNVRGHD